LSLRSQLLARKLLSDVMRDIERVWGGKVPQSRGTVWPMPKAQDRTISFDLPVMAIDRIVRAFSKFEPFLFLDGIRYFVRRVDVWQEDHSIPPGTLVLKSNRERVYAAIDGFAALSQYRRADRDEA
jgi:methionyl-tRNA formyltransferase